MQNDNNLVTIITPVFNGGATIARTIESVLNQTYSYIEYIIMDGKSSDRTLEIIKNYEERFIGNKSLRVVSEPDKGMYEALNKGVRMAHGFLIGSINADDWYEPYAVEEMVRLNSKSEYDIAWADLMIHGNNKTFIKKAKVGRFWTTAHFCHPTMFCKRKVLLDFPYLEQNMDDDFDMILRANNAGVQMKVLNRTLAHYSMGGMSTEKGLDRAMERISMKCNTYARNGYSRCYCFHCVLLELIKCLW